MSQDKRTRRKTGETPASGEGVKRVRGERQLHVYRSLRREIQTLVLRPGEALDETRLAQRYETSRSPVREALIRLAADGLVVMLANRSTLVAPFDLLRIPKYLDALNLLQRTTHRLAALQRKEHHLEGIKAAQKAFLATIGDHDASAAIEANLDFHFAIAEASCNPYFASAYRRLLNEGMRMQHMHIEYMGWAPEEPGVREHQALIEAITARDADEAERLARSHAEQFDQAFIRFLSHRLAEHIEIFP